MSKYGLKIKNYEAAVLYEYNLGLRTYLESTDAMFCNSLLLDHLKKCGLQDYKGKSTRDIICVKFSFGCASYKNTMKKFDKQIKECKDPMKQEFLMGLRETAEDNKKLYKKIPAQELRTMFYENGIEVPYVNKSGGCSIIRYKMFYRTPGKAKEGSCMFINEDLYDDAIHWIRMGLTLPEHNAPIVEMGAYSSLSASSIVGKINIPPENILVIPDVDAYMNTKVVSIEIDEDKHCQAVEKDNYQLKNVMFDGQALIDSSIFPDWGNGYILLRHHFFKAAAFNSNIQLFMKDHFGDEYATAEVTDMFGRKMKAKDVLLITTENALKFLKFDVSFDYWSDWVRENGCQFGIVKTAHPSKLGEKQRMSYQMVNAMDLSKMEEIVSESMDYINSLKKDDNCFLDYLTKNVNFSNDFEVLLALVEQNPDFVNSTYFRDRRSSVLSSCMLNFKNGRLLQNGDNLVIVGSPYAMLMHSVGDDPLSDSTFETEEEAIQCYSERFDDDEYLAEFRSPMNSRNNIGLLHNCKSQLMVKYFNLGKNCVAVNMNGTIFQSRNNGLTYWSGFREI